MALRVHRPTGMSIHLLLVSRKERQAFALSFPRLAVAPYPELDPGTLSWIIDCPIEALEFTRVGPVDLVHGGAWARERFCESIRWPFLDQPVIYGRAVGIRMGVRWPGECTSQPPQAMRALTAWEGRNALDRFQDHLLPLSRLHCPVDEAFLASLGFPLRREYLEADEAGKLAIRQRVMAEREAAKAIWVPKIQAQIAADRIQHPVGSWLAQQQARKQELSRS
jgi:hypothetical protein